MVDISELPANVILLLAGLVTYRFSLEALKILLFETIELLLAISYGMSTLLSSLSITKGETMVFAATYSSDFSLNT